MEVVKKKRNRKPEIPFGGAYTDQRTGITTKVMKLHAGQIDCLNSTAKVVLACGGIRSGKSTIGAIMLHREIEKNNGKGIYLVVSPTLGIAMDSTMGAWEKVAKFTPLEGERKSGVGGSNPWYQCKTGAKILFKSAEGDFEGLSPLSAWMDEAGEVSQDTYFKVLGRITGSENGRLFLTSTPYQKYDWLRSHIMHEADSGSSRYFYRSFPTMANPFCHGDAESIEDARKHMPDFLFRMRYLGEFTRPPALVWDFYDSAGNPSFIDMPPQGLPPAVAYYAGVDFGGNDPNAVIVGLLDRDGILWCFAEWYEKNEDVISLLQKLVDWNKELKKAVNQEVSCWYCDHRPDVIKAMRMVGLNAVKAKKGADSIASGISMVQSAIRTGRLKIISRPPKNEHGICESNLILGCPSLKEESMLYRYPSQEGLAIGNVPIDKFNHSCDALRYLCTSVMRNNHQIYEKILGTTR